MSTYCCEFCGEDLDFRMIGGTTVPLHPAGSTCRGKKYYRSENIDRCVFTYCPKCEGEVYFVRHNGGSVWFDSLGRPWPKHGCFDDSAHRLPARWIEAEDSTDGMVVQVWLYGLLRGEDGGAFLITENIKDSKPQLKGAKLERLLCAPGVRERLEQLDGKLVIRRRDSVTSLGGITLKRDGWYQSSLPWWPRAQGKRR
jgi:hypothetical protein